MGLLTTAQKTAIMAGAKVRQVWKIYTPRASGSTTFDAVTIHDDDDDTYRRVVDPGSREVYAYNVSFKSPGKLEVGSYEIVVDNHDGYFCPAKASNVFYNATGSYQAMPCECDLEHKVYVWDAAAGPAAWSELTMVNYRGRIETVLYEDVATPAAASGNTATIESRAKALQDVLDRVWDEADGIDEDTGLGFDGTEI